MTQTAFIHPEAHPARCGCSDCMEKLPLCAFCRCEIKGEAHAGCFICGKNLKNVCNRCGSSYEECAACMREQDEMETSLNDD